jgi:transcriptional regulator with XRE-family HTH domain
MMSSDHDPETIADPWLNGLIDKPTQDAIIAAMGDLLRKARLTAGLKLVELAEQCSISQSVLCRVELARRQPGLPLLMTVCAKLGIRASDLLRAAEDAAVPFPESPREGRFRDLLGM